MAADALISALAGGGLSQEKYQFKAILGYTVPGTQSYMAKTASKNKA